MPDEQVYVTAYLRLLESLHAAEREVLVPLAAQVIGVLRDLSESLGLWTEEYTPDGRKRRRLRKAARRRERHQQRLRGKHHGWKRPSGRRKA